MSAMDEKNILNLISKSTEPEDAPDFSDIAAKSIAYKYKNRNEKPPRKYNLKRRLIALGVAAAVLLGIAGGGRLIKYIQTELSPYGNVLRAFEKYNRASYSFSWPFTALFGANSVEKAVRDEAEVEYFFDEDTGEVTKESKVEMSPEGSGGDDSEYSETNVQVEGVDEADIVKGDGKHFFIQSASGKLRVVNAAEMKLVSEISAEAYFAPSELYLSGGRLVQVGIDYSETGLAPNNEFEGYTSNYKDIKTKIVVYNIKNPAAPVREGEYIQDGSLISSRVVDGAVYLVSGYDIANIRDAKPSNIENYIPSVASDGVSRCVPADSIEIMQSDPTAYTVVSGMMLDDLKNAAVQTVLGSGHDIYASSSRVYIYGSRYETVISTAIMSFDISGGSVKKSASGTVPGTLINQFCLDEYKGYLRVGSSGNGNSVYILDDKLKIVGRVENLAPGEDLKSVRFMGEKGYLVTFIQTDPLFAIDLSNPKKPVLLGELKIPGFSTYMHPYDENTIIGIGFDADPYSGVTTALKLSLFDVSDPARMRELKTLSFGENYYNSEALTDHRAVLFSRNKNLLVIPAEYDTPGEDIAKLWNGAIVLTVSSDNIQQAALISHAVGGEKASEENRIRRTAYIGDKLYSFSEKMVMCVSLTDYSLIGKVEFAAGTQTSNNEVPVVTPDSSEQ